MEKSEARGPNNKETRSTPYTEKDMSIEYEKAHLEASINVLQLQRKCDTALAKAEVTESAAAEML
ncbi:unnamed protein product [Menidia menidia]|uniref:(Atlantic silverside) hypothetical protein n=1 Tax=Menidia menidia TaxID=238744 RepID=A0A8S4BHJ4_9TELE|nr:unnamed protein product [Menidia menidia]